MPCASVPAQRLAGPEQLCSGLSACIPQRQRHGGHDGGREAGVRHVRPLQDLPPQPRHAPGVRPHGRPAARITPQPATPAHPFPPLPARPTIALLGKLARPASMCPGVCAPGGAHAPSPLLPLPGAHPAGLGCRRLLLCGPDSPSPPASRSSPPSPSSPDRAGGRGRGVRVRRGVRGQGARAGPPRPGHHPPAAGGRGAVRWRGEERGEGEGRASDAPRRSWGLEGWTRPDGERGGEGMWR
jgi:hypothetical protein